MASHRRPKQPGRTRVSMLTATAAAAVAISAQAAHADPKSSRKDEVKHKVDKLYEEAEKSTEKYDGAKERQSKLQKEVGNLQDSVAHGQDDLNQMRDGLGSMASAQYRSGGVDPSVQLFLSSHPDNYLDKASTLDQLSTKQVGALKKIQNKQRALGQQRQEAKDKLNDLADTRKELGEKKKHIQGKLSKARSMLNSLTAKERAKLAAEQRKKDQAASSQAGGKSSSARAAAAFAAAKGKIGAPYVWGGTGPSSFDCSGLVQWAYKQAGVSLPRQSQAQKNAGQQIGRGELKTGDLVIFNSDASHVGLYAGNGQILHAPKPGASVRFEKLEYGGQFSTGVRVG